VQELRIITIPGNIETTYPTWNFTFDKYPPSSLIQYPTENSGTGKGYYSNMSMISGTAYDVNSV